MQRRDTTLRRRLATALSPATATACLVGTTGCTASGDERAGALRAPGGGSALPDDGVLSRGGEGLAGWLPAVDWGRAFWWAGAALLLLAAVAVAAFVALRSAGRRSSDPPADHRPAGPHHQHDRPEHHPAGPHHQHDRPDHEAAPPPPPTPTPTPPPTPPSVPAAGPAPVSSPSPPQNPAKDPAQNPPQDPAQEADVREPLVRALTEVAAGAASQAVTQQIDRLLAAGVPDRDALVRACIRHRDQLSERFPDLGERLRTALRSAGVHEVHADGRRFDGRVHESVDLVPTTDPAMHDLVAETTRCGYVDGDRVLRVPRVAVYRLSEENRP